MEDVEFTEWLTRMRENATDDNVRGSIDAIRKDEKVLNYLKSGVMAQADYTRKTTEVANSKRELETQAARLRTWFEVEGPKNTQLQELLAAKEAELDEVRTKGVPSGNPLPTVDLKKYVPREEFEKLSSTFQRFDKNALAFNLDLAKVQTKMRKENIDIDIDKVYDFAAQNSVDLVKAFDALSEPERKNREKENWAKMLKEAEQKGAREALSKHNLPDSSGRDTASGSGMLYREGITDPRKRQEAAMAAFMDTGK